MQDVNVGLALPMQEVDSQSKQHQAMVTAIRPVDEVAALDTAGTADKTNGRTQCTYEIHFVVLSC